MLTSLSTPTWQWGVERANSPEVTACTCSPLPDHSHFPSLPLSWCISVAAKAAPQGSAQMLKGVVLVQEGRARKVRQRYMISQVALASVHMAVQSSANK